MPSKQQIDAVRQQLTKWDDSYHNGVELVSDEEYDRKKDWLEKYSPDDRYFTKVGAPTNASNKVRLKYPMPSLKKARIGKGVEKWLEDSSGDIAVLDKLDGSSAAVEAELQGTTLVSRGDGKVGQNITRLLKHIKGIPAKLPRDLNVRGELLISTANYKKYTEDYDNPRQLANSQVTSTKKFHEGVKDITFVAHEVVNPSLNWKIARVKLKGLGFTTAPTTFFTNPTPQQLEQHLKDRRAKSPYELDGLVLIDLKTGKRISFKVDAPPVKMIVDHVQWNISQNSIWKPKVIFKQSVNIGGVMVKQATAHNARYVFTNKIGPGSVVMVIRSGDVIPKVVGVAKRTTAQMPDNYIWDAKKVEALADELDDDQQDLVYAKRLVTALVTLDVPKVKIGTAEKLVAAGIKAIEDCFSSDANKRILRSGIGNVASTQLIAELKKVVTRATHAQMMQASGIWPKGFTITRFSQILVAIPYKQLIEKYKQNKVKLRNEIADLKGFSTSTANVFLRQFAMYVRWLRDHLGWRPMKDTDIAPIVKGKLNGQEFVFTKVRDKACEAYIVQNGGVVANRVTKSTTLVIKASQDANSDKTAKAEDLGIKVVTLAAFKKQHKL